MTNIPFKIFPSSGYINSDFQIVLFEKNCNHLIIEKDDILEKEIDIENNNFIILTKFNKPGIYQASCVIDGLKFTQRFEVRNSIRLGTSELKTAFAFEEIPFSIFFIVLQFWLDVINLAYE